MPSNYYNASNSEMGGLLLAAQVSDFDLLVNSTATESAVSGNGIEALPGPGNELNFDNLYPVLLQTFVVIVLGYLSGRWGIIGSVEAKGLNTFVGNFALPCIIFTALAELDFSRVNWMFLLAILISKLAVFVGVLIFTLLLTRPMDFSKAGLFAIFCTQSNDFALGYPIVAAVYGNSHPEYAKYLYVMAPISLVLLNPIAFLCLEIGERRRETQRLAHLTNNNVHYHSSLPSLTGGDESGRSTPNRKISSSSSSSSLSIGGGSSSSRPKRDSGCKVFLTVWKNMLFTPIVLMTVMGISVNFLCNHEIPALLKNLCGVLSSAFSATALFALGLRMVGQMQDLGGTKLVVPGILIGVKCLVMPILTREVTIHMEPGINANASLDLSNLGFLLGTFPSAPGTLFYAIQYNVAADMIATAMVACTFISTPLTFVSARMVSLSSANPADYIALLDVFLVRVASVGLVCAFFMLVVFMASKKWKKVPHFASLCLVVAQCMGCTGIILWYVLGRDESWKKHLQFMVFATGVFGSRIWSALASVTLLLLRMKNLSYVLKARPFLLAIGWGIPVILASSLCSFGTHSEYEEENPNFQFGKPQAFVASSVLIISFTVTIICLVWQQRLKERPNVPLRANNNMNQRSTSSSSIPASWPDDFLWQACQQQQQEREQMRNNNGSNSTRTSTTTIASSTNSIYHLPLSRSSSQVLEAFNNYHQPHQSYNKSTALMVESLFSPSEDAPDYNVELMMNNECDDQHSLSSRKPITRRLTEPEECGIVRDRDDEFQIMRHVTLLLALSFSMFVGIAVCVWTLVMEELTGIYVMLLFLDETLNFGQSIFVFVLFGLEPRRLFAPVWSGLRRQMKTNHRPVTKASKKSQEQALGHTCEQFMMFYMDKCIRDLVRDRTWHLKEFSNVFCGNEMVEWLMLMGLARDRSHAEKYGQGLLDGGIICHVDGRKDFHDQPYFYSFL